MKKEEEKDRQRNGDFEMNLLKMIAKGNGDFEMNLLKMIVKEMAIYVNIIFGKIIFEKNARMSALLFKKQKRPRNKKELFEIMSKN